MEIRPASFGENLNEWFRLLGRTWKPLLLSSLIAFAPVALVVGVLFAYTTAGDVFVDLMDPDYLESVPPDELWNLLSPFAWVGLIWAALQTLASLFVYIASARIVAEERVNQQPTWRTANAHARKKVAQAALGALILLFGFVVTSALAGVIGWLVIEAFGVDFLSVFITAVVGLTALVVFAWIGLSIALFPQVLAFEDAGATGAIQRSFHLIQGRWWVTAGFILVTSLIASAVAQVASIAVLPLAFVAAFVPATLGLVYGTAILIQGPLTAAMGAAYASWYIDLRSRKEQLTTEQLVQD